MTTNTQQILDDWHTATEASLVDSLDALLSKSGDVLIEFASKAENQQIQVRFFEAQKELYLKEETIRRSFTEDLHNRFFDPIPTQDNLGIGLGSETLSLLDKVDYDLSVALDSIAQKCITRNQTNLYALQRRLSAIYNGRKFEIDQLPGNPKQITKFWNQATRVLEIEPRVTLVLYMQFDRYIAPKLDDAYADLNHRLVQAGILPTIKYELPKHARRSAPKPDDAGAASGAPEDAYLDDSVLTPNARPASRHPPAPSTEESLRAITDLLGLQRRNKQGLPSSIAQAQPSMPAGSGGGEPAAPGGAVAGVGAQQAVDSPQVDVQAPHPSPEALTEMPQNLVIDKRLMLKIRQVLYKQREIIKTLAGNEKMSDKEENAIDIVGLLFEAMLNDDRLSAPVKTLLSHLHTPYLKIAVHDETFLDKPSHPARVLFETMLEAGSRWVDPDNLQAGIFRTLQGCVHEITRATHPDMPLYKDMHTRIEGKISQLIKAKGIKEKRTLEAEKGRARMEQAKFAAMQGVSSMLHQHRLSEPVETFFRTIFVDYLSLLLLRNNMNPQHPVCESAISVGAELIAATDSDSFDQMAVNEAVRGTKRQVLQLIPHYEARIEELLGNLTAEKNKERYEPVINPKAGQSDETAESSPEEVAAYLKKIHALTPGMWYEQKTKDEIRRVKLLWINPHTHRTLFVDQHGEKAAILSEQQLFNALKSGEMSLLKRKRYSNFFDSFVSRIRNSLQSHSTVDAKQ